MTDRIFEQIKNIKVVATVVIDDVDRAVPLAETLLEGGIYGIELTLRTNCAIDAIKVIRRQVPDILVGAGTVLTEDDVRMVKDAGGQFAVSPGLDSKVLERSLAVNLPFSPGVCTPSDIEKALVYECQYLKFFPAEPLGGINYLKCMAAPYLHKGIQFMPLGGIHENNFGQYLTQDYIFAVGGSWLAPRKKISEGDWEYIKAVCERSVGKLFSQSLMGSVQIV